MAEQTFWNVWRFEWLFKGVFCEECLANNEENSRKIQPLLKRNPTLWKTASFSAPKKQTFSQ
jgi:hypothetical protein